MSSSVLDKSHVVVSKCFEFFDQLLYQQHTLKFKTQGNTFFKVQSQGRAKVCSYQIFYQHFDNLNMRHQGDLWKKIFSFCFKLSIFSCIAASPNLLSVIDVLHTYDDSNCSIWRRHHLVRHSLGNLMKGIFRKTCFDTIQNSKRDLSIWKRLPPPPIPFICANLCFIFFRDPIWH